MSKEIMIINEDDLKSKIYTIRGMQVMLDRDLAEIYGYETRDFNNQVKNNSERFDEDFRFQLTKEEFDCINLMWKKSTSSWGGTRKLPYVFTEQGVYMLMTVLKGKLAVSQSKTLVRLFKQMKDYVVENQQIINQRDFLRLSLQTTENAQNYVEVRQKLSEIDDKVESVVSNLGDMVRKSELSPIMRNLGKPEIPPGWLVLNGQPAESDLAYQQIYSLANKSIFIIDNYISLKTLVLLKNAKHNVAVTVFSDNIKHGLHQVEFDDFCKEFPGLKIDLRQAGGIFHDRYIILDYNTPDVKIYHCGASSKDGGRRVNTISLIEDTSLYNTLITQLLKSPSLVLN